MRAVRGITDRVLARMTTQFDTPDVKFGRPLIPPEKLLRALLLQALYTIRSERQLMEQIDYNVFVMSVLERYSDRECALLLGCSCTDILPARIRALQQISTWGEESYPSHGSGTEPCLVDADWLECV